MNEEEIISKLKHSYKIIEKDKIKITNNILFLTNNTLLLLLSDNNIDSLNTILLITWVIILISLTKEICNKALLENKINILTSIILDNQLSDTTPQYKKVKKITF